MEQLAAVLSQSIQQYEHILHFLQGMGEEMGTADPVKLQNFTTALNALQAQAIEFDQMLLEQLQRKPLETDAAQTLFAKRKRLLKEVLVLNERITAKALGVKSLIAHELGMLSNGLTALSGYKQQQHNQGWIVNRTS